MTSPALAAARFGIAALLGAGLGLIYGFLRPLRPKLTHLADLMFVVVAFWVWLYLGFGVCGGDIRLAYTAALAAGGFAWEMTAGRLLRPVFFGYWRLISKSVHFLTRPVKKILNFFAKKCKKLLAIWKKWVTIEWNIRRSGKQSGGAPHGKAQKEKISHRPAQEPSGHLGLHPGGGGAVHRGTGHFARKHRKQRRPV